MAVLQLQFEDTPEDLRTPPFRARRRPPSASRSSSPGLLPNWASAPLSVTRGASSVAWRVWGVALPGLAARSRPAGRTPRRGPSRATRAGEARCIRWCPGETSSSGGTTTKSKISAESLPSARRSTRPRLWMNCRGFVLLARINARRTWGMSIPSSRHRMATKAFFLPSEKSRRIALAVFFGCLCGVCRDVHPQFVTEHLRDRFNLADHLRLRHTGDGPRDTDSTSTRPSPQ